MYTDGTAIADDAALNAFATANPAAAGTNGSDRATRQHVYANCLPALRRWARARFEHCGIHDADDLVQIALLRALRRLNDFEVRGDGSFLAYLRQILLNEVRREWRRLQRRGETIAIDEALSDNGDPVVEALLEHERERAYAAALARLNGRQRTHVAMRIERGMTFNEIARETGGSADGARMTVTRALHAMTAQLAAA